MKKMFTFIFFGCMFVSTLAAQELDNAVKDAVNKLAERLNRPLEISVGSITLEGTDLTSGFSLYLYRAVMYYADNNNLFQVVNAVRGPKRTDEPQKGIITGIFAQRGNTVEVNLYLVSDFNGLSLGSARFTVPVAELTRRNIAVAPENREAVQERERIFAEPACNSTPPGQTAGTTGINPVTRGIAIQAWFGSESRTYFHRDELKMTVAADTDCYFKVIHIDANGQMKMIYPNSYDRNNYLKANTPRNIFETAQYFLYGPYGAETVLIAASAGQFANIEREYITPRVSATAQTVRTAVRGGRGGDLETTGAGEKRYNITVLKPDDGEREYERGAENMTETVQKMRMEIERQGGFFEGTVISGYYTLGGKRGSYRVSPDAPDILQVVQYNLGNYTVGPNTSVQARGAGFTFSFARPGNIQRAVQAAKSGIEVKGGSFTGNEQQGSFKANGITGRYRVEDMVNITITEKPFLVPNAVIEREVKNYFGER